MKSRTLRTRYVAALAAIALLSITGQVLVQTNLITQESDSAVINLAGRQRMLSQRIVKTALIMAAPNAPPERRALLSELIDLHADWTSAHERLQNGDAADNSDAVNAAFADIERSYRGMSAAVQTMVRLGGRDPAAIARLLSLEAEFLRGMDRVVSLYEHESSARVRFLQRVEFGLLGLVLLTLLLEGVFVFRPAERRIRDTLERLRAGQAEKAAILSAIPDTLVRVNRDGVIDTAYAPSSDASGLRPGASLDALLDERTMSRCLRSIDHTIETGDETAFDYQRQTGSALTHLEARLVPCEPEQALLILRDITVQRKLERELLRAAERERTRIGQDLHDGLCQHLAGLAILAQTMRTQVDQKKVTDAHALSSDLNTLADLLHQGLQTARQMSRGLFPQVLVERGLADALYEVCAMVRSLHKVQCACHIDIDGVQVDDEIAFQLYRMAQEAVGNAIRHGRAGQVELSLVKERQELCLRVIDDGVGVDADAAASAVKPTGGIGLRSMSMRARAIGAEFSIHANPPAGTQVVCRLPLAPPPPLPPLSP